MGGGLSALSQGAASEWLGARGTPTAGARLTGDVQSRSERLVTASTILAPVQMRAPPPPL